MPHILAVALENHPGALSDVLDLLSKNKFNVSGIEAEALGDFGRARILVDDSARAAKILRKKGYDVVEAEAIELDLPNKPGELARVMKALAAAKVNVVSLYGTTPSPTGSPRLLLRVNNAAQAKAALGLV